LDIPEGFIDVREGWTTNGQDQTGKDECWHGRISNRAEETPSRGSACYLLFAQRGGDNTPDEKEVKGANMPGEKAAADDPNGNGESSE